MPPPKNGSLGRGLGELFGGIPATIGSAATLSSTGFVRLSPDLIGIAPEREAQAQAVDAGLVESIRTQGMLQPILVRRRTQGYEVVAGARRLVAARLAGLKEIPALIIQADDAEVTEISRAENTCREHVVPAVPEPVADVAGPVATPVEKRCWTPARGVMVLVVGLVLLGLGAGVGYWLGRPDNKAIPVESWQAPAPYVAGGAEARAPVIESPAAAPVVPVPELSEIKELAGQGLALTVESNGVARIVFDEPLFSTRVTLADDGKALLQKLGALLAAHGAEWSVVVVGHTDAIPLRGGGLYRDNKELGLARAMEVSRYLMREAGVSSDMLQAATAGEDHPPHPGDEAESRRKNRTVTLRIGLRQ